MDRISKVSSRCVHKLPPSLNLPIIDPKISDRIQYFFRTQFVIYVNKKNGNDFFFPFWVTSTNFDIYIWKISSNFWYEKNSKKKEPMYGNLMCIITEMEMYHTKCWVHWKPSLSQIPSHHVIHGLNYVDQDFFLPSWTDKADSSTTYLSERGLKHCCTQTTGYIIKLSQMLIIYLSLYESASRCCDIFRAKTRSSLKLQLQFVVVVWGIWLTWFVTFLVC